MLTPADAALAARDPELSALPLLLDPAALAGWLTERSGLVGTVHAAYARYKPGTSCVLGFEVVTAHGVEQCVARAYTAESAPKLHKAVRGAPAGSLIADDVDHRLLVSTALADRHLPGIAVMADPSRRARFLSRASSDPEPALRTLRYNPERRWVAVARPATGPSVVVRAVRRSQVGLVADHYRALQRVRTRTPRLLAAAPRRGLVAVEWVDGSTVDDQDGFGRMGTALARLHADTAPRLHLSTRHDHGVAVRAAGRQLAYLLPDLDAEVLRFADLLSERMTRLAPVLCPAHGDFSADQVVVDRDGEVVLIDLDSARLADPAADLASATAAVAQSGAGDDLVAALYDGYAGAGRLPGRERLAVYGAAHLMRRAGEGFRRRRPDWEEQARRMFDRAEGTLAAARHGGVLR